MTGTVKLTEAQRRRLRQIASYVPSDKWPHAAFWKDSRTDQSLVKRGLVERIDHTTPLIGQLTATWHLCRLTSAGRAALDMEGER